MMVERTIHGSIRIEAAWEEAGHKYVRVDGRTFRLRPDGNWGLVAKTLPDLYLNAGSQMTLPTADA